MNKDTPKSKLLGTPEFFEAGEEWVRAAVGCAVTVSWELYAEAISTWCGSRPINTLHELSSTLTSSIRLMELIKRSVRD